MFLLRVIHLQPDDQFQAIEMIDSTMKGYDAFSAKRSGSSRTGLEARLPTTESLGRWRQSTRSDSDLFETIL